MIDREKVIEGLKKVWDAFNSMEHELYADYVFDALELLKEQEAVEPIRIYTNYEQHWKCGKCNAVISLQDKFCHECGSPILWKGR